MTKQICPKCDEPTRDQVWHPDGCPHGIYEKRVWQTQADGEHMHWTSDCGFDWVSDAPAYEPPAAVAAHVAREALRKAVSDELDRRGMANSRYLVFNRKTGQMRVEPSSSFSLFTVSRDETYVRLP